MHIDNKEITRFYATPTGTFVERRTCEAVLRHMPSPQPKRILGIGYLQHIFPTITNADAYQSFILGVPKHMGITKETLPPTLKTIIIDDELLPFSDCSFDLIIVAHGFENGQNQERFLREVWRVLDHKGTIILIVPHKMSVWCRYDTSPFSHGNAFTTAQLAHVLRARNFTPIGFEKLLFVPPVTLFRLVETYLMLDTLFSYIMPTGGLILGVGEKRLLIHPPCDQEPSFGDWLKQKVIPGSRSRNFRK